MQAFQLASPQSAAGLDLDELEVGSELFFDSSFSVDNGNNTLTMLVTSVLCNNLL